VEYEKELRKLREFKELILKKMAIEKEISAFLVKEEEENRKKIEKILLQKENNFAQEDSYFDGKSTEISGASLCELSY